jgi:hypothetical protein
MKGGRSAPVRIPNVEGTHPLTARQGGEWEKLRRNDGAQPGVGFGSKTAVTWAASVPSNWSAQPR